MSESFAGHLVDKTLKAPTKFVFRPGGVAAGNVYTSFATLYTDLSAAPGLKELVFDDSISTPCTVPAGTYDFTDTAWTSGGVGTVVIAAGARVVVYFANGVTITNLNRVSGLALRMPVGITPAPIQYNSASTEVLLVKDSSVSSLSGAGPLVQISGGTTLAVRASEDCNFGGTNQEWLELVGVDTVSFNLLSESRIQDDSIIGAASSVISQVSVDAASNINSSQPNFLGSGGIPAYTLNADASRVTVDPSGLTHVTLTQVQGAIAELDAAVGGGGGGGDLAATLVLGNITGPRDIEVSAGQVVKGVDAVVASGLDGSPLTLQGGAGDGVGRTGPIVLTIGADGSLQADATGNTRGLRAVDLQTSRASVIEVASGLGSCIPGGTNNRATATNSFAAGVDARATGISATAFSGWATGRYSFAGGGYSEANGDYSFCWSTGPVDAYADGYGGVCFGAEAGAQGDYSFAHGYGSYANGNYSVAMGDGSTATGTGSMAVNNSTALGVRSFSMGSFSRTYAAASAALAGGANTKARFPNSFAFGSLSQTYAATSMAFGTSSESHAVDSLAFGRSVLTYGIESVAFGDTTRTDATAPNSMAGGRHALATVPGQVAWSASRFIGGALGVSQWSLYQLSGRTNTTTPTGLRALSSLLVVPASTALGFVGHVTAYDGSTLAAFWDISGLLRRAGVGSTVLAGSAGGGAPLHSDGGAAGWSIAITADLANDSLEITVTGPAGTVVTWSASVWAGETA